jgi:Domain of unknown function (DUF4253)/Domain of unknown function (DUF4259)
MGAWSHDAFGNDTACDWAYGLEEVDDLSLVEAALATVVDTPPGPLDADAATEALAAVEVVARLRGHAGYSNAYTECTDDWVLRTRLVPPPALLQQALAALQRIGGDDSELKQLWDESDSAADWRASLDELRRRLLAPPQPLPAPLDDISRLVQRVGRLVLEVPALPELGAKQQAFAGMMAQHVFASVISAEVLGDPATVREGIARLWQPVEAQGQVNVLWDLAVREAKTWAAEGRLDLALAGLAPWREAAEVLGAGTFDGRCMAVCQEAGDYAQAERLRDGLMAAGHGAAMQRMDRVLLQARTGPLAAAQALFATHAADFDSHAGQPWRGFVQGLLAVRSGQAGALALLTDWIEAHIEPCNTSPAWWPFFGVCAGWWALALHQEAGRSGDARAVVAAMQPLLLIRENELLVDGLKAAGLLDAQASSPAFPRPPSPEAELPGREADHGAFQTVTVRGVNALQQVQAWRRDFLDARSPRYPVLIGDDEDLAGLLKLVEPPVDGGLATLAAARALDLPAWLAERGPKRKPRWPKGDEAEPGGVVSSQFDTRSGRLKPLMHVGLFTVDHPSELFARLGYGGWNDCPEPALHVALQRRWFEQFGALPVAVLGDIVECAVPPLADREALLRLAMEQHAYCPDIVEQGVGSTAKLAASLLNASVWYFWWD